jgi:hypothetical protein
MQRISGGKKKRGFDMSFSLHEHSRDTTTGRYIYNTKGRGRNPCEMKRLGTALHDGSRHTVIGKKFGDNSFHFYLGFLYKHAMQKGGKSTAYNC